MYGMDERTGRVITPIFSYPWRESSATGGYVLWPEKILDHQLNKLFKELS